MQLLTKRWSLRSVRSLGRQDEKIVREELTFQRDGGWQLVRKAKQVGDPLGGREPSWLLRKTLRLNRAHSVRGEGGKGERGRRRGRRSFSRVVRGSTWEVIRPKRAKGPALDQKSGVRKGPGFSDGTKPLERRVEVLRGFNLKRRDGEEFSRRRLRSSERRNALKGEAQECWELKEALEDI
jgi:hypothetical protein